MSLKLLFRKLTSPIYQQKNQLTFVVLFSVLVIFFSFGLTSQVSALACIPDPCRDGFRCNTNTGICVVANLTQPWWTRTTLAITPNSVFGTPNNSGSGCGLLPDNTSNPISCAFGKVGGIFLNLIIGKAIFAPLFITGVLALIAKLLLNGTLLLVTAGVSYTTLNQSINPAIAIGWPIIRNLANMLIVVGLIVIALATILRIKSYEAKQLLGKLIIVALLVNFSLVICGIFIDIANILMTFLLTGGNGVLSIGNFTTEANNFWTIISSADPPQIFYAKAMGNIFFNIAYIAIIPLYICLFLFRVIALWILVILSPLAFICAVFPKTQHIFSDWYNNFTQWCFVGVFGALFLYLGDKINSGMTTSSSNLVATIVNAGANSGASGVVQTIVQHLSGLFSFIVPGMFLVIGFIFALKFSAMGSDIALSAGKALSSKAKSFAMDKSGITRLKNKAQDYATATGEKFGLVDKGTTMLNQKKRLTDAKQRIAIFNDDPKKLAEIANQKVGRFSSEKDREEKSAAAEMLASQKKFGMIDADKQEEIAAHSVAYGAKKSTFTDAHPELLTEITDEDARRELIEKKRIAFEQVNIGLGMTPGKARIEAESDLKRYTPDAMEIKIAKEQLHQEKVESRVKGYKPVTDEEAKDRAIDDKINTLKSRWRTDIITLDPSLATRPKEVEVMLQEKAKEARKDYQKTYQLSESEIIYAKQALQRERGTPEGAARDTTTRAKIRTLNPEMTDEDITQKIQEDEYQKYDAVLKGKKIDEIAKIAMEEPQTSRGTKALEELFRQKRTDLLKNPILKPLTDIRTDEEYQDAYIIQRLQVAQKEFGSNAINDAKKVKAEYAKADIRARDRLVALDTSSLTLAEKQTKADEELIRRSAPKIDTENRPKRADEQIKMVVEKLLIDPSDPLSGVKRDASGKKIKIDSIGSDLIEELTKNGHLEKLVKALGGLNNVGEQIKHITEKFDSDALKYGLKNDPRLKKYDTEAVKEERNRILTIPVADGGYGYSDAKLATKTDRISARKDAKKSIVGLEFSRADINNLSEEALGKSDLILNTKYGESNKKAFNQKVVKMVGARINALKKSVEIGSPERSKIDSRITTLRGGSKKDKARAKELDELIIYIEALS